MRKRLGSFCGILLVNTVMFMECTSDELDVVAPEEQALQVTISDGKKVAHSAYNPVGTSHSHITPASLEEFGEKGGQKTQSYVENGAFWAENWVRDVTELGGMPTLNMGARQAYPRNILFQQMIIDADWRWYQTGNYLPLWDEVFGESWVAILEAYRTFSKRFPWEAELFTQHDWEVDHEHGWLTELLAYGAAFPKTRSVIP